MVKFNDQFYMGIKALSNKIRLNILEYLKSGEKCVCDIFDHLKLPQNLISHHLRILRESKLIRSKKVGKWVYYLLNKDKFKELEKIIGDFSSVKTSKKSHNC